MRTLNNLEKSQITGCRGKRGATRVKQKIKLKQRLNVDSMPQDRTLKHLFIQNEIKW